jgi:hypothetical protein
MRASFLLSFASLFLLPCVTHAQNLPQVKVNYFKNLPANLYFFDDATVRSVSYLTRGTRSTLIPCSMLRTTMSLRATSIYRATRGKTGSVQMISHKEIPLCL